MRSLLTALILSLFLISSAASSEVRLSVAASMTDAFKELVADYEQKVPEITLLANFASSGALAKQIAQGAPADIYISANPKWMNYLVQQRFIPADQVSTFAHNSLVFIGGEDAPVKKLDDITQLKRIAIGSPKSVPAGQYAEQALRAAGLYEKLQDKLILAKDVRQALMYADRGETDGAFVYRTDALLARDAVILLEVPQSLYQEVTYPIAATKEGLANSQALAFLDFLKTEQASAILKKYGFVVH